MLTVRAAAERGHADHGWLRTWHSFSFADYFDPRYMGWGALRVLNEDIIAPGTGFGMHGHRDMEIVTYVLSGALTHRDSMGHTETLHAGEVQRMSAGRGVLHSEMNHGHEPVHLLQIWIVPAVRGIEPGYEQKAFDPAVKRGRLHPIALPVAQAQAWGESEAAPVRLHADAALYAGCLDGAQRVTHTLAAGRLGYVHVVRGRLELNGVALGAGDAAMLADVTTLELAEGRHAELLLFDLAADAAL